MTLSWIFPHNTVENVKRLLTDAISKCDLPAFANITWTSDELCIRIDKGGKSEFRIVAQTQGSDVIFVESRRNIALFHRPFVGAVETTVNQIMDEAGAKKR